LARKGKTVALAESCTGGLAAKLLTDVPGASRYFSHGWVTYANEAKIGELGVPCELLEEHGAVSEEVARAMASGAREKAGADYGIGITGIAGPGGGTEQKEVGLTYICVDSDVESHVKRLQLSGERDVVRRRAAQTALNMLRLELYA
jgi:nicotinamide-nucleotide amidase